MREEKLEKKSNIVNICSNVPLVQKTKNVQDKNDQNFQWSVLSVSNK